MPSDAISPHVADECRVFAQFLAGVEATPYVVSSYARLLPSARVSATNDVRRIERALLAVARAGVPAARIADSYARFFLPRSLLRRRLILLLAVLENSPQTERPLNSAYEASLAAIVFRLGVLGVGSVLSVILGIVIFAPLHLTSTAPDTPTPGPQH